MTSIYDQDESESLRWALEALSSAADLTPNRTAVYEYWFDLAVEMARGPLGENHSTRYILATAARAVCWEIHTLY